MFPLSEYIDQGSCLAQNLLLGRPTLPTFMFYVTDICNSRCNVCHLWKTETPTHLSVEAICKVLDSPLLRKSAIGLEGGEFFLHPDYRRILQLLKGRRRLTLISNGLMPERLLESVSEFNIPNVLVSLDGGRRTYERVRGVDGYEKVCRSILELRGRTNISVIYTFNPWNGIQDFLEVQEFCRQNGVGLKTNIFHNVPLLGIQETQKEIDGVGSIDVGFPEKEYLGLYNGWLKKRVKLPCMSIRFRAVVWPDGSVPLCQAKNIILGNIHEQTIDEIWRSPRTRALWNEYYSCNDCWMAFHRIYDVALVKMLQKIMPGPAIKALLKEYVIDE